MFSMLRGLFNIDIQKKNARAEMPVPAETNPKTGKVSPMELPAEIQKLWKWWLSEAHDTSDSLKNRFDRYRDLDFMYYNNTVVSMAVEMYADETVQADSQSQTLQVTAKNNKVKKWIEEFFERIGVSQKVLRSAAFDLCLYGDHFWVNATQEKEGIVQVVPIDIFSLTDRIEFSAIDAERKQTLGSQGWKQLATRDKRLISLAQALQKPDNKKGISDYAKYFQKFLFGFQLNESQYLPPWNVVHFRRFTSKSEFYPFGRPLLINAIAPFRMLQASKNLVAMARAAKFPREHFEVQVDENMTEAEKWAAVNEARQEYLNLGLGEGGQTGQEDFGAGSSLWTPEGLISFNLLENRMNIDDISDLEMLRDDLILATRVPKGYLIVDRASFGTSGQALLQQFKPFGRAVFSIQSALLEELVFMVKLQMLMTGAFNPDEEDFELTMSFPVVEESSDRVRMKSDTLRLANDVISNLQSALGLERGESIPTDVVKDIFSQISFLEPEDVDEWIKSVEKSKEKQADGDTEGGFFDSYSSDKKRAIREKIRTRLNEQVIKEAYFHTLKKNHIEEGVFARRHFMMSFVKDAQKDAILDVMNPQKLLIEDEE